MTVQEVNTPEAADIVRHFHDLSMERRGVASRPLKDSIIAAQHELVASGRVRILISYLNGEPAGAKLLGVFNGLAYGLVSGSSNLGKQNWSPVHLTWASVQLFKEQVRTCLSLGGAKEHEKGLKKFKLQFGTIETPQPAGYKIISRFGKGLGAIRARLQGKRGASRAKRHVQAHRSSSPTGSGETSSDSGPHQVPADE